MGRLSQAWLKCCVCFGERDAYINGNHYKQAKCRGAKQLCNGPIFVRPRRFERAQPKQTLPPSQLLSPHIFFWFSLRPLQQWHQITQRDVDQNAATGVRVWNMQKQHWKMPRLLGLISKCLKPYDVIKLFSGHRMKAIHFMSVISVWWSLNLTDINWKSGPARTKCSLSHECH